MFMHRFETSDRLRIHITTADHPDGKSHKTSYLVHPALTEKLSSQASKQHFSAQNHQLFNPNSDPFSHS